MNSSIVANNVSSSGPDIAILAGTLNASNSLIEDGTINGTNTNNITATDPGLAPNGLQNNGGVTQTIALENGSPAIDAGSNPNSLTTDQRGFVRSLGAGVDIGAVEANQSPSFTSSATFTVAENTTTVGTIVATDPESDTLTYSITGSGADDALFTIDGATGVLSFEAPGDVGTDNVYNVQVAVTDGTNTPVTQDLTVTVTDPLQLWLKADAGITANDGESVTTWQDQSANAYTLSPTETNAPVFSNNSSSNINFNPTVEFSESGLTGLSLGSGNYIFSESDGLTAFAVIQSAPVSSTIPFIFDFGYIAPRGYGLVYNQSQASFYTSSDFGGATTSSSHNQGTIPTLLTGSVNFDQGQQTLLINGASITSSAVTIAELSAATIDEQYNFEIGYQSKFLQSGRYFNGNIGEIVIFNKTFTDAERNEVESYLAIKYGISLSSDLNYTDSQGNILWNATAK